MKKTFFGLLTAMLALNGVSAYAHGNCHGRTSKEGRGERTAREGSSGRVAKEGCSRKKGGCGGRVAKESPVSTTENSKTAAE